MSTMRAKMKVTNVATTDVSGNITCQRISFSAVYKKEGYDASGDDENNTYAKWTPQADANFVITNPALFNKFELNEEYYVDFTKAD